MATKKKLQELLKDRETKREAVTPVSLYTKPQEDKQIESRQVDKATSTQTDKATNRVIIKNLFERYVLLQHFSINRIDGFCSSFDRKIEMLFFKLLRNFFFELFYIFLAIIFGEF